jgi:hypothetical protein
MASRRLCAEAVSPTSDTMYEERPKGRPPQLARRVVGPLRAQFNARVAARTFAQGGHTALLAAAYGGHGAVVARLLSAKAAVNATSQASPRVCLDARWRPAPHVLPCMCVCVCVCVFVTHTCVCRCCSSRGGQRGDHRTRTQDGSTALHLAAIDGHGDVLTLLLEARADVNARALVGTPCAHSCARLLSPPCLPCATQTGEPALFVALPRVEVVQQLMAARADPDVTGAVSPRWRVARAQVWPPPSRRLCTAPTNAGRPS